MLWPTCLFIRQQFCFVESPYLCCHISVTEQGRASSWYNQTFHIRPDTYGPRIPTKYPDKMSPWQNSDLPNPSLDGLPLGQSSLAVSRSQFSLRHPETGAISSGLHKGTLFWVTQRITSSSQPFGFNGLVNFRKDLRDPYKITHLLFSQVRTCDCGFCKVVFNSHSCHFLSTVYKAFPEITH